MTDLIHYAPEPVELDGREYRQDSGFKPVGLWYSVGDGWGEWCRAEDFSIERLATGHSLHLNGTHMLRLSDPGDVFELAGSYETEDGFGIHWNKVAREYSGVEFAPYFWHLRHGHGLIWYYGLDCASGCVWDLSDVTLIQKSPFK